MPTIVYREQKGSALTTAELDANLTNINAETVDNSAIFNLRPSLDVDIVGSKTLSPLASFSRASTGTYYDANGVLRTAGVNEPRFNYDPATGEFKGLLVEESRTNLLTYSEQFDNSAWNAFGIDTALIVANSAIAPDGTLTADYLKASTTNTFQSKTLRRGNISVISTVCFSVHLKYGGYRYACVHVGLLSSIYVDLQNGIITQTAGGATGSCVSVGNGWYRVTYMITFTSSTNTTPSIAVYNTGTGNPYGQDNWVGDGINGIYIWGAQYEAGSTPTSYIPTTSAAVTRQADQLSISKTTSNWFNSVNGTLSLSHDVPATLPLLGEGSNTITNSLGAGTTNIDYSNSQLSVVSQSGQSNYTQGIFNFDSDMYILGNSTTKANAHVKYLKFYPNNVVNSTPDGSGFILDNGFALLQEDGSVLFQE